jgi:hypothetical protein
VETLQQSAIDARGFDIIRGTKTQDASMSGTLQGRTGLFPAGRQGLGLNKVALGIVRLGDNEMDDTILAIGE